MLRGGLVCCVRVPLYLLRQVLTLAVKMVRTSSEFILFFILNWWWLTIVYAAGSMEIPHTHVCPPPLQTDLQ